MLHGVIEVTGLAGEIWSIVSQCRGRANAISRAEICRRVDRSDRTVRRTICDMVTNRGLPIAGDYGEQGGGYYVPASADEAADVAQTMIRHGVAILARAKAIANRPLLELMGQQTLFDLGLKGD